MAVTSGTILVTGSGMVPPAAIEFLEQRGFAVRHVAQDAFTSGELHEALDGVVGYMIGGYEEPLAEHFDAAGELRAVGWVGTDYKAYVPGWERAIELGVAFLNAPGANAPSVAEFASLLMLAMARPFSERILSPGGETGSLPTPGRDLFGRRLGIIGLGRIGAHVARIAANGFGMRVAYTAPRRQPGLEEALGVAFLDKHTLLSQSEVVSLHRPGPVGDEPFELSVDEFALLGPGTILINTAHHRLVDPSALADAVETRGVRAAVDGVGPEESWSRLVAFGPDRFLAVPPMAFNTEDANLRASLRIATGICEVLEGRPSSDVNNPDFQAVRDKRLSS
jgi:D-3-phosphoglycerate dehydrogenase / 2-oxoglutarate reductase